NRLATSCGTGGDNGSPENSSGWPQHHAGRDLRASNVQSDCPELLFIVHLQAGCDREGDDGPAARAAEGQEGESVIAPRWSASPSRPCCRLLLLPASECHARDYEGAGVLLAAHSPSLPSRLPTARSDRAAQTPPSIPRCFARSQNLAGPNHLQAGWRCLRCHRPREPDAGSAEC